MAKLFDIMGKFPFAPDDKKPMLIRKQDYSTALYPPDNAFTSDNTFTMITTDTFMLGIYELGPGGVFAPLDIHPGVLLHLKRTGCSEKRKRTVCLLRDRRGTVYAGRCLALLP